MKITPTILIAIRELMAKRGMTTVDLARKLGISRPSIAYWLSGKSKSIRPAVWVKLEPMLVPHLPPIQLTRGCPECPLQDCPAKGIPHEPLTSALLDDWTSMTKMERLEALTAISEIRAKIAAAGGKR